ncbi:RNA polymerase sigma factor [Pseudonocardia spirodelae]|uniref:Sigma factor-like helix-turn-helix DNA-binding protein n=1 Tax=Pseudonocardia spirodelae TaxID=3133431 RepID=A0ABU8T247_9PSEU
MAQRFGADGEYAEPDRASGFPHTGQSPFGGEPAAEGVDHGSWTGAEPEAPPMSGAVVQQHRTLPHGELRADFGAHLETHYPRLVAQLYAITLNPHEAHEAVQDAYSRAWRRWSALRAETAGHEDVAVGWVRRVAIRTSMRARVLRRRRRPSPEETDPRTGALLEALGRLAPVDRRAVVLHHMAGLSTTAVADLERVTEHEVRRRLVRGREIVTEGMAEVLEEIIGPAGGAVGGPPPEYGAPQYDLRGGYPPAVEGGRA